MKIKKYLSPGVELLRGLISYLPGFNHPFFSQTGGTNSARYCYSVWLRHLVLAYKNNLPVANRLVAELGPGDSLGMGLAALLSGAEKYYAFDVVRYADYEINSSIFRELVELFEKRSPIPDEKEFPKLKPQLDSYNFPDYIFSEERLRDWLKPERIEAIKKDLEIVSRGKNGDKIIYFVPWNDTSIIENNSVDMIFSQATLEHIDDIENTYSIMYDWLKPAGFMTHQIDFKCHGTASRWNGHWAYSDWQWKLLRGKRSWLLNRSYYSHHMNLLKQNNFEIIYTQRLQTKSEIKKENLKPRFQKLAPIDLETSGVFFIAKKIEK